VVRDELDVDELDVDDEMFDEVEIIDEDEGEDVEAGFRGADFAGGLLLGVMVGAALALLLAPQAGPRTRRNIGRKVRRLRADAEHRLEGAQRDLRKQVRRRKRKIKGKIDKVSKRTRKAVKRLV